MKKTIICLGLMSLLILMGCDSDNYVNVDCLEVSANLYLDNLEGNYEFQGLGDINFVAINLNTRETEEFLFSSEEINQCED